MPYLRGAWDLLQQDRPDPESPDQLAISPALGIHQVNRTELDPIFIDDICFSYILCVQEVLTHFIS